MDVLTTRVLTYPDESGAERDLVLTVFVPFAAEDEAWECTFNFGPPIHRKMINFVGGDFLQALLHCLAAARVNLETTHLFGRAQWEGMVDCGLPERAARSSSWVPPDVPPPEANPGSRDVLTTRGLSYPDESSAERELLLTVLVPFKTEDEKWKCGFTFGPPLDPLIRYGVGADFLEALLDCLATARATLEGGELKGRVHWAGMVDCGLPYKIGRSFGLDAPPKTQGMQQG
jgi:hypothetical protein